MTNNTLRLYVADLHAYNDGRLIGRWIDVNGMDANELREAIAQSVGMNPYSDGERNEHAFHDHEGFGDLIGEYTGADTIAELIEIADELEEDWPAYVAYASHLGETEPPDIEAFRDAFRGTWDNFLAYATDVFDDIYANAVPERIKAYIDYDAFARDLKMDYFTVEAAEGGVYVFES